MKNSLILILTKLTIVSSNGMAIRQFFESNGKIFIVVSVSILVFVGFSLQVSSIGRKVNKLSQRILKKDN